MLSDLSTYNLCLLQSRTMARYRDVTFHNRNQPLLVEKVSFMVSLYFVCLSTIMTIDLQLTLVCMSTCFSFIFCTVLMVITFLFGLTVYTSPLFQFANHQITLEMSCPCTILVPYFQSSYSCIGSCHGGSYMYISAWIHNHIARSPVTLKITQPVNFLPKPDCFFGTYCLQITPHLQSTIISNNKCSVQFKNQWASVFHSCSLFFVHLVGFIFVVTGVQISVYMKECALSYHL